MRILLALGTLLTVLAIFAVWAERQALDTDEWVDTSSELLADDAIQEALGNYLVDQLFANVDVQQILSNELPGRSKALAGPATGALRQAAGSAAIAALDSAQVQTLWAEANRHAHDALLKLLDDDAEFVSTTGGVVSLDLHGIVGQLGDQLGIGADVADKLPPDAATLVILQSDELSAAQTAVSLLKGLAIVLTVLALLSFALAIYLGRGRRALIVLGVGVGLIAAGLIVLVLRQLAETPIVNALAETEAARDPVASVWLISTSLLTSISTTVIIYGALFMLAAGLASETKGGLAVRRVLAPSLRERPGIYFGLLVAAFLIYLAAAPSEGLRLLITVAILATLAVLGLIGLRRQAAEEFPDAQAGDTSARIRGWFEERRGGAVAPADPETVKLEQLERLAQLQQSGVLDADELAAEKRRILSDS